MGGPSARGGWPPVLLRLFWLSPLFRWAAGGIGVGGCPPTWDMPNSYSVDQNFWTLWNTFTVKSGSEQLGVARRSPSLMGYEVQLYTPDGDLWASMSQDVSTLHFSDCNGHTIGKLQRRSSSSLDPSFDIIAEHGSAIGEVTVTDEWLSLNQKLTATVSDLHGNINARLVQVKPMTVTHTEVKVVQPGHHVPDLKWDPRLLSLLAASRLGTPVSYFFLLGPLLDLLMLILGISLCTGCLCLLFSRCCRRGRPRDTEREMWPYLEQSEDGYDSSFEEKGRNNCMCCTTAKTKRHQLPLAPVMGEPY